jgi:hypothetical protein
MRVMIVREHPELFKFLLTAGAAVATAFATVSCFGVGLTSPPATTIDAVAQYENIRLPVGGRTERGLKSFVVRLRSIDDYARVYVNNRQVISSAGSLPFEHIAWSDAHEDYKVRFGVNRSNPIASEVEVRRWLRQGVNWIMIELENSRWGACSMVAELLVNGAQLEGSPYFIPHREQVQAQLSNPGLRQRLGDLSVKTSQLKEFGVTADNDALCARLIFGFELY